MNITSSHHIDAAVIGGGAAGFFAAIRIKELQPAARVVVFERSQQVLTKVGLSGGGRCNVTNTFAQVKKDFKKVYPRGYRMMQRNVNLFGAHHMMEWLEQHGVELKEEDGGRMFPISNSSQTIVNCLTREAQRLGVEVVLGTGVTNVETDSDGAFCLYGGDDQHLLVKSLYVLVTTGGNSVSSFQWIEKMGLTIEKPCPSLFSFELDSKELAQLSGVSIDCDRISLAGTSICSSGALLITHKGVSGPAVLRLSSYAARELFLKNYSAMVVIRWISSEKAEEWSDVVQSLAHSNPKRLLKNIPPQGITERLWNFFLLRADIHPAKPCGELGAKGRNRIVGLLTGDNYKLVRRTTHKEEFVTCGGVSMESVQMSTLESKKIRGLFFAGEVLDVDAVTGGFNLQAAWTTGYTAAQGIVAYLKQTETA